MLLHDSCQYTGTNAAAVAAPDIETTLLTEEEQAQQDANALVKVLKEANRKCEELAGKRHDAQAAQEKREVEQREAEQREAEQHKADTKVRGKLLANAAVAEVQCQFVHQVEKARLAAEKLQMEWEVSRLPQKVRMHLGVSFFFFFVAFETEQGCRLPLHQ